MLAREDICHEEALLGVDLVRLDLEKKTETTEKVIVDLVEKDDLGHTSVRWNPHPTLLWQLRTRDYIAQRCGGEIKYKW